MGGFVALATSTTVNLWAWGGCALTAMLLQILSNLANDYGDFQKGIDNERRTGPQRVLQSGELSEKQMRMGIAVTAMLVMVSGALLVFVVAGLAWKEKIAFGALGIAAALAALGYTLGKRPYGYCGLGDLFCFLFFGWVAVIGSCYLMSQVVDFTVLLPATAIGCLSNAVLNINNMRDHDNDKASGKNSLVVVIGLRKAFVYHCLLIGLAFICLTGYLLLKHTPFYSYVFWLLFPLFLKDVMTIKRTLFTGVPDPLLPKQVLHTFLLTVLFGGLLLLGNQ